MTPSPRSIWFSRILVLVGIAGILDALILLLVGVAPNIGTLFFGIAGVPCLAWGMWRALHGHVLLPWPRRIKRPLTLLLLLWLLSLILFTVVLAVMAKNESDMEVDYAVVLGAGLRTDRVSAVLKERLDSALSYLSMHPMVTLVVSGGKGPGESRSEAQAMAEYLVARGVSSDRILKEDQSLSTWENLQRTKALLVNLQGNHLTSILIITSDFHVPRAKMLARRLGFEAYGRPSATPWYQIPNCLAREYFAFAKSWLFDR